MFPLNFLFLLRKKTSVTFVVKTCDMTYRHFHIQHQRHLSLISHLRYPARRCHNFMHANLILVMDVMTKYYTISMLKFHVTGCLFTTHTLPINHVVHNGIDGLQVELAFKESFSNNQFQRLKLLHQHWTENQLYGAISTASHTNIMR